MTILERNLPRLREVVAFLSEQGTPTPVDAVVAHVEAFDPPTEPEDLQTVSSGRTVWLNNLLWHTTGFVRAGWITKDGKGVWCITPEGRHALSRYPDGASFVSEANRIYDQWYQAQKAKQRRAWLVRGSSVLGANIVLRWLDGGWVSLAASQLREISKDTTREQLEAAAREDYDHLKYQELTTKVNEILAFVMSMAPGDVVMTTSDQHVFVGDITGGWTWQPSADQRSNLRRPVTWRNIDTPIDFAHLPDPLPAKLSSGATVVDLTAELDLVDGLTQTPLLEPDEDGPTLPERRPRHEHLGQPSDALAEELLVDAEWLAEVRELLDERKQLIFYGPPGTGKTFVARKLAADLVGLEQVKLVQFHPAYTYEDFFEGYRPKTADTSGVLGFDLKAGPLRELVNRAREHDDQAFVLIIDEINRANLAKVFGELYFLLEYRDQAIDLMYSSDETGFTLPRNLYLIGTMNTADRSIALIDAAMRRRFAFKALDPSVEPTRSLLRRWSKKHGLPTVAADLLDELNFRIADPDFQVGPSYFMRRTEPDAFERPRLERIWNSDILPLLQEHFYGEWEAVSDRYRLDTLFKAAANMGADERGPDDPLAP